MSFVNGGASVASSTTSGPSLETRLSIRESFKRTDETLKSLEPCYGKIPRPGRPRVSPSMAAAVAQTLGFGFDAEDLKLVDHNGRTLVRVLGPAQVLRSGFEDEEMEYSTDPCQQPQAGPYIRVLSPEQAKVLSAAGLLSPRHHVVSPFLDLLPGGSLSDFTPVPSEIRVLAPAQDLFPGRLLSDVGPGLSETSSVDCSDEDEDTTTGSGSGSGSSKVMFLSLWDIQNANISADHCHSDHRWPTSGWTHLYWLRRIHCHPDRRRSTSGWLRYV
jgi:hypothetical protein